MSQRFVYILIFLGLMLPSLAAANDFDKVCGYFDELSSLATQRDMSNTQRSRFIEDRITKELKPQSDARGAWEAVSTAMAAQRYRLFKTAAESVLHQSWSCKSMEKLAEKTGEFE